MNAPLSHNSATAVAQTHSRRFAIILAGGSGTRLWPLSRATMPKQLLPLNGSESLLQQTFRRVLPRVGADHVLTVTHADHRFEVAGQSHAVNKQLAAGVMAEPMGRNTLPAIAWAVAKIAKNTPDALVGVFSSDHAVANDAAFLAAWDTAEKSAEAEYITLFGMQPSEPATGFGYIQSGEALLVPGAANSAVKRVSRFVEKPNLETAKAYLQQGGYYWNGGMFVFRADVFLKWVEKLQPKIFEALPALLKDETGIAPKDIYTGLPDLSIDYGVLEHCDKVAVVPVDMGWSDLGSWEALYQQRDKDEAGNVMQGNVLAHKSEKNLLWSEHGMLATMGLKNVAVVQTRDATLVCSRDQVDELKQLVAKVKEKFPALTETHMTVARPWGSYTVLEEGPFYKVKRIQVKPGHKLSMQMHHHRAEHWVVIAGTARIVNGEQEIYLEENQSTYIPKTHKHRLENPGKIPLQIIEIQTGTYLEEDDIVRFNDVYGRT
ncbi:MAG: mannose-1-phosphate guanylyltransferase/mannose-6-phosphate isomerase [Burkholderiales bacterium]